jgi:peptide/nickel transport system permease protein
MRRYIIIRTIHAVIVLFIVSLIVFSLARVSGNPVDALLPDEATQADYERIIEFWGLDRPLHEQYFTYIGNIFRGDFGESFKWRGMTADRLFFGRLPATIQLAFFALVVAALLALPLGVVAAVKKDTGTDYFAKVVALLGQSLPSFWLGIVLMWIFAVMLGLLPTSGRGESGISLRHMVLPAVALGLFQVAALTRLIRSSMLEVLDSEYVKLARIKGLSETKVIWKHCLRNAALVPITYFGLVFGSLVTGSVVIETVFAWPGVGLLAIEAVRARDYQVLQTVIIFFTLIYVVISLVVDILYAYLDPRIRYN